MSEGDFIVVEAIISQKQPACQPLLNLVTPLSARGWSADTPRSCV